MASGAASARRASTRRADAAPLAHARQEVGMRLHIWALAALAGLGAAAGAARAQADPKTVVATVNGQTITLGEVDTAMKAHGPLPVEISVETRKRWQYTVLCGLIDARLWEEYLQKNG